MAKRHPDGIVQFLMDHPDGAHPAGYLLYCGGCKERRPVAEFYLQAAVRMKSAGKRVQGSVTTCRSCARRVSGQYRAPRTAIMREAKAGGCVDCGLVNLDHPEIFDFDHHTSDKVKNVCAWLTSGTEDDLRAEIARCEVVCANCHRIRTASRPHGARGRDGGRRTSSD